MNENDIPNPFQALVAHHISVAYHTLRKSFVTDLRAQGLSVTPEQFVMLATLNAADGLTQRALAVFFRRDGATITRIIDTLEKKQMVVRKRDDDDRRVNLVHITGAGRALLKELFPIARNHSATLIEGLMGDEIAELIRLLKIITVNAETQLAKSSET